MVVEVGFDGCTGGDFVGFIMVVVMGSRWCNVLWGWWLLWWWFFFFFLIWGLILGWVLTTVVVVGFDCCTGGILVVFYGDSDGFQVVMVCYGGGGYSV